MIYRLPDLFLNNYIIVNLQFTLKAQYQINQLIEDIVYTDRKSVV